MSTFTYDTRGHAPAAPAGAGRGPFWSRLFDALVRSQQRRAEREIARYLASHGDLLTDGLEREAMLRLTGKRPL